MNVLLIGSGGREHTLAYKINESAFLNNLYISPGNPGTKELGENLKVDLTKEKLISFCTGKKIDLVVIGPEKPLVDGVADILRNNGIKVFGPDSKAAEIEASKSFAKYLMKKHNIPSADYVEFNSAQYDEVKKYLNKNSYPCVIKADGLAAGKGVIICTNSAEALITVEEIFINKVFGSAGDKIVIEEFMEGEEASIFAITDGKDFICLPSAQDHKRIGDNDTGKNTGGMGAYSPAPIITNALLDGIKEKIIEPTLKALMKEGRKFIGCLYCGLMITNEGPKVVEYNCRFGDPETQAVLPLLKGDFLKLLYSAAEGHIDKNAVDYSGGSAVCVVAASKGYPDSYKTGFIIKGLNKINDPEILIFHAGTKEENGNIVTAGGRVLGITSVLAKNDLAAAKEKSYNALQKIYFRDIYFRNDIANKALQKITK